MRPSLRQVLFRSAAGLDLNFAGGAFSLNNTRTDTPAAIPGWSFSRTDTNGTATALDLAGNVIQFPSRTNLVLRSQQIGDGVSWALAANGAAALPVVTLNGGVAPDGSLTASRLQLNTVGSTISDRSRVVQGLTVVNSTVYASSIWLKAFDAGNVGKTVRVANDGIGIDQTVTLTADWVRVTATGTSSSTSANFLIETRGTITTTTADVLVWGAQLETGSTATAYIPTTTAAVTVVLPRITNRGILVEEARTNVVTLSNTAGTGTGITTTNSLAGAPDGTATAGRMEKSNATTPVFGVNASSITVVALTSYTFQRWFKYDGFDTTVSLETSSALSWGLAANAIALFNVAVGGVTASTTTNCTSTVTARANGWFQCTMTFTSGAAITSPTNPSILTRLTGASGVSVLCWGLQVEAGAFATSPIITTGAAGTRDGEVVSLGTAALPPEGTIILTYVVQPTAVGTAARTYGFNLTDAGNSRFSLRIGDSGLATTPVAIIGDGAALTTLTGSSLTPGTTAKVAVSYSSLSAQFAMAVNGSDQTGARQAVAATLALTFRLGSIGTPGTNAINSPIARAQIIPRFLSAAERIALTAP